MVDIVIATHGNFAEGLCNAAKVIMGSIDNVKYIGLDLEDCIDDFTEHVLEICKESNNDVLIFTDLLGASPYNASAKAISDLKDEKKVVCISGVNLPILLEGLMNRSNYTVDELADYLINIGRDGIQKLALNLY